MINIPAKLKKIDISKKVLIVNMLTSFLVILLTVCSYLAYEIYSYRQDMVSDLIAQSNIVGNNSTGALAFKDAQTANEILSSLKIKPNIEVAIIFDKDKKVFAHYTRPDLKQSTPPKFPQETKGHHFTAKNLILHEPIIMDSEQEGTVYIISNLDDLWLRLAQFLMVSVIVLLAAIAISFLIAHKLGKIITYPIHRLADAATKITEERNYSIQVEKLTNDEIGIMTDKFNTMIKEIEQQAIEINNINKGLEEKIKLRTRDFEIAKDRAEAADQAKTDFLANMSHEIRTPMTAILGFADILLKPEVTNNQRIEYINTIKRSGEHLLMIINDILDISKIVAGRMKVETIPCSPLQIIGDIVSLMSQSHRAKEKGLALRIEFESKIPKQIMSDPVRLKQMLVNLTGNAIKFTKTGEIAVTSGITENPETGNITLYFKIKDSGIGLTTEQGDGIFEAFKQADTSTTRKFGGTGLGLAITKKLANLLNGDITFISTPGLGSIFTLTLNIGNMDNTEYYNTPEREMFVVSKQKETEEQIIACHCNVLLAEDGEENQELISYHLRNMGAEVTIVENGKLACESALAAVKDGTPYDIFFCDMQMPIMDGYTAVAKLRAHHYKGPIIALTAHAMIGDREKCLNAGCDDYTTKPISVNILNQFLIKYSDKSTQTITSPQAPIKSNNDENSQSSIKSEYANNNDMTALINKFVDKLHNRVDEIKEALEDNDITRLKTIFHQLKGSAAGYGFPTISELAQELELNMVNTESTSPFEPKINAFISLCQRSEKV